MSRGYGFHNIVGLPLSAFRLVSNDAQPRLHCFQGEVFGNDVVKPGIYVFTPAFRFGVGIPNRTEQMVPIGILRIKGLQSVIHIISGHIGDDRGIAKIFSDASKTSYEL